MPGSSVSACHMCHMHSHNPEGLLRTNPLRHSRGKTKHSNHHRSGHRSHHHHGYHSGYSSALEDGFAGRSHSASALARLTDHSHAHSLPRGRSNSFTGYERGVSILPDGGASHFYGRELRHGTSSRSLDLNPPLPPPLPDGSLPRMSTLHQQPQIIPQPDLVVNAMSRSKPSSRSGSLSRAPAVPSFAQDNSHDYYLHLHRQRFKEEKRKHRFNLQTVMLIGCYTLLVMVAIVVGVIVCYQNGWLGLGPPQANVAEKPPSNSSGKISSDAAHTISSGPTDERDRRKTLHRDLDSKILRNANKDKNTASEIDSNTKSLSDTGSHDDIRSSSDLRLPINIRGDTRLHSDLRSHNTPGFERDSGSHSNHGSQNDNRLHTNTRSPDNGNIDQSNVNFAGFFPTHPVPSSGSGRDIFTNINKQSQNIHGEITKKNLDSLNNVHDNRKILSSSDIVELSNRNTNLDLSLNLPTSFDHPLPSQTAKHAEMHHHGDGNTIIIRHRPSLNQANQVIVDNNNVQAIGGSNSNTDVKLPGLENNLGDNSHAHNAGPNLMNSIANNMRLSQQGIIGDSSNQHRHFSQQHIPSTGQGLSLMKDLNQPHPAEIIRPSVIVADGVIPVESVRRPSIPNHQQNTEIRTVPSHRTTNENINSHGIPTQPSGASQVNSPKETVSPSEPDKVGLKNTGSLTLDDLVDLLAIRRIRELLNSGGNSQNILDLLRSAEPSGNIRLETIKKENISPGNKAERIGTINVGSNIGRSLDFTLLHKTNNVDIEELKEFSVTPTGTSVQTLSNNNKIKTASKSTTKTVPAVPSDTSGNRPSPNTAFVPSSSDAALKIPSSDTAFTTPSSDTVLKIPSMDTAVKIPTSDSAVKSLQLDPALKIPQSQFTEKLPRSESAQNLPQPEFTVKLRQSEFTVKPPKSKLTVNLSQQDSASKVPQFESALNIPQTESVAKMLPSNTTGKSQHSNAAVKVSLSDPVLKSLSDTRMLTVPQLPSEKEVIVLRLPKTINKGDITLTFPQTLSDRPQRVTVVDDFDRTTSSSTISSLINSTVNAAILRLLNRRPSAEANHLEPLQKQDLPPLLMPRSNPDLQLPSNKGKGEEQIIVAQQPVAETDGENLRKFQLLQRLIELNNERIKNEKVASRTNLEALPNISILPRGKFQANNLPEEPQTLSARELVPVNSVSRLGIPLANISGKEKAQRDSTSVLSASQENPSPQLPNFATTQMDSQKSHIPDPTFTVRIKSSGSRANQKSHFRTSDTSVPSKNRRRLENNDNHSDPAVPPVPSREVVAVQPGRNRQLDSSVIRAWTHMDSAGTLSHGKVHSDGSFSFTNCRPAVFCDSEDTNT